jgi:7,8-dihydro-6-hydroxymethylpterin-pyrophosphokinase
VHERRFVLQPLSEFAPDLILPGQTISVAELLYRLPPDESMRKLPSEICAFQNVFGR